MEHLDLIRKSQVYREERPKGNAKKGFKGDENAVLKIEGEKGSNARFIAGLRGHEAELQVQAARNDGSRLKKQRMRRNLGQRN